VAFGFLGLTAYNTIGRLVTATVGAIIMIVLARSIRK